MTTLFSFTEKGGKLAKRLQDFFGEAEHFDSFHEVKLSARVQAAFPERDCLVFVGATGIAVRAIAPCIRSKDKDPAVISVDELGRFVVPLLSGHLGGANEIAKNMADFLGAQAVISTATDLNEVFAVDTWAKKQGLLIRNIGGIKHISAALLRGEKIGFSCDFPVLGKLPDFFGENRSVGISISMEEKEPFRETLQLVPKRYCLGVGCRRDVDSALFEETVLEILGEHEIPLTHLLAVASVSLKAKESAILAFCQKYQLPFSTYPAEKLAKVEGNFTSSAFVQQVTGVDNVCERSACLRSQGGAMILRKTSRNSVTVAVSEIDWRCSFEAGDDWC